MVQLWALMLANCLETWTASVNGLVSRLSVEITSQLIEKSLQNILTTSGGPVGLVEGETDGWLVSVVGLFEGKAVDEVVGFGVDIVKGDTVGLGDRGFVMAGEKVGADGIVVSVSVGIDGGPIVGLGVGVVDDCFSLGTTPKVQK